MTKKDNVLPYREFSLSIYLYSVVSTPSSVDRGRKVPQYYDALQGREMLQGIVIDITSV